MANTGQVALEAWRVRGLDGRVNLGSSEVPAVVGANILAVEFVVHSWDVAWATDRKIAVDETLSGYVLELARSLIRPQMRDGDRFAAEIELGPDAD